MNEHRPDLQFGLSEEELVIARKALRLPEGAKLTTENYRDWCLVRDTWLMDVVGPNSHPGHAEERGKPQRAPVVETKKVISMSKYRR